MELGSHETILDPKILLRQELARRCEKNPRYSLRAFARSLGISHTVLSLVLSGKRKLSKKAALKISDALARDSDKRAALFQRWAMEYTKFPSKPTEVRTMSHVELAMDPSQIPYALKRIQEFQLQLARELDKHGSKSAVYHMAIQICPVSRYGKKPGDSE